MTINLPQSQWLDQVAQEIEQSCDHVDLKMGGFFVDCPACKGSDKAHPYAETGIGGWLRAKKGSEWPSLVWWETGRKSNYLSRGTALDAEWDLDYFKSSPDVSIKYVHALDYLDAFALLEDAGWCTTICYVPNLPMFCAAIHVSDKFGLRAQTVEELLDKIREAAKDD